MSEMAEVKPSPSMFGGWKLKVALGLGSAFMMAAPVAAEINWTEISDLIEGVGTNLFPALITLITAAIPIIIVVSVVGFIVAFLDKILGMLKV